MADHCPSGGPPDAGGVPPPLDPAAFLTRADAALGAMPAGPTTTARRFFFDLECATHPQLWPHRRGERVPSPQALGPVVQHLRRNLIRRGLSVDAGGDGVVRPTRGDLVRSVAPIADLVRKLIERRFQSLDDYQAGVVAFANADLRYEVAPDLWTCQPSSGLFFLMGEFALVAATLAAHDRANPSPFWTRVAAADVRAQAVFAKAFPCRRRPPAMGDYHPCGARPRPAREVARLLASQPPTHAYPEVCRLAGRHALELLGGELIPWRPPEPARPA